MSYVNSYYVTYRRDDFYIELRLESPDDEKVTGIVYISPYNAKGLMNALSIMVSEYEEKYGKLPETKLKRVEKEDKDYEEKDYAPGFII